MRDNPTALVLIVSNVGEERQQRISAPPLQQRRAGEGSPGLFRRLARLILHIQVTDRPPQSFFGNRAGIREIKIRA